MQDAAINDISPDSIMGGGWGGELLALLLPDLYLTFLLQSYDLQITGYPPLAVVPV